MLIISIIIDNTVERVRELIEKPYKKFSATIEIVENSKRELSMNFFAERTPIYRGARLLDRRECKARNQKKQQRQTSLKQNKLKGDKR